MRAGSVNCGNSGESMAKFVIVVGGIVSGVGKGLVAASIALLLKSRSFNIEYLKFDPYLCINAGLLNPNEHGEVFVLDDSTECDLDLGHIERITGLNLTKNNICTSGTLFKELIEEQERGDYLGKTITNKPFITDKVIGRLDQLGKNSDIVIAEIGGTVDDIESSVFLEALCQLKQQKRNDCLVILVSPVLWMETIKEYKTKPLQRSVRDLQSYGIIPDILVCRSTRELPENIVDKVCHATNINKDSVFVGADCASVYDVPIQFYKQNLDDAIVDKFGLKRNPCKIHKYKSVVESYLTHNEVVKIGVVGKYNNFTEAYLSLKEAVYHAAVANEVKAEICWINAKEIDQAKDMRGVWKHFENIDAVIIPGGFDSSGIEGKIKAIKYVREKKIPFLGICLGLQCAVIEVARNICHLEDANSVEFDKATKHPVIHFVEGQENIRKKSGTMRLGAYDCELVKGSIVHELYKKNLISERHRHRFEVNGDYVEVLEKAQFVVSGNNPDSNLVEMMEFNRELHPFFVATQSHPEFKSRLGSPAPLFDGLIEAALAFKKTRETPVDISND